MEHVLPLWASSWSLKNAKSLHRRMAMRVSSLDRLEMADLLCSAESHYKKDSTSSYVLQLFIHALVMTNLVDKNRSKHLESQSWMDG
ncbi:unnamed protein product, partial [Vitis vinifera]|uniref:Uncharacterized protein n=1 Tax=Vitis vinifera TaxID=29760 RepID=D7U9S3_VITVI